MRTNLPRLLFRQTIYPVLFILTVKFASVFFLVRAFNFEYQLTGAGILFSSFGDFLKINTYSSLLMLGAVFLGLAWAIFQAHYLHATHFSPDLSRRLAGLGVTSLIKSSVYPQASPWLGLAWLSAGYFFLENYLGLTAAWLLWLALPGCLVSTWLLLWDAEREINVTVEETVEIRIEATNEAI